MTAGRAAQLIAPKKLLIAAGLLMLCFHVTSVASASGALVGRVRYDQSTGLYSLKLPVGTPAQEQLLTLDVEAGVTTLRCREGGSFRPSASSTFRKAADGGGLARDTVTLKAAAMYRPPSANTTPLPSVNVTKVGFDCSSSESKLPGVAALGRGRLSLPAQLSPRARLPYPHRFAYCLTLGVGPGPVYFGGDYTSYVSVPGAIPLNMSEVLSYTALGHQGAADYTLALADVTVDDVALGLRLRGASSQLRISTRVAYTKLESSAYAALRAAFRHKIGYSNASVAAPPVAPFDTCFNASSVFGTRAGPSVPAIGLRFRDGATLHLVGLNSVVAVSDSVLCLAFVDAGAGQPHVLGSFQQQGQFLEFDVRNARLGFSFRLDLTQTTCGNFLT